MLNRRGKSFAPTFLLLLLVLLAGYGYYLYNEQYSLCLEKEGKLGLLEKRQTSLKSQLHVVYEHRTKLEAALIKEKKHHRATKQDFIYKMKDCHTNLTKGKYEAMNRFNALDTEHKMLKAKHEEVTTDYSNLQQQYVRLSEDHQKVVNGQKEDFERLRDTKDKESRSLQKRVANLYNEKEEQKAEASKYFGYYRSERNERVKLTSTIRALKDKVSVSEEKAASFENERDELKEKYTTAETKFVALQKRIQELEIQVKKPPTGDHEERSAVQTMPNLVSQTAVDVNQHPKLPLQPTVGTSEQHASKQEQENVKSKILGRGTKRMSKAVKPSNEVQRILIGKTSDAKKEDSLIDEYKTNEAPRSDDTQGAEVDFVGRPVQDGDVPVKQADFHDLVTKAFPTKSAVVSDAAGPDDATKESKKPLEASESRDLSESKGVSPSKSRVSQYSKVKSEEKAAGEEKASETVVEGEKDADTGERFLKKQQQLMHRVGEDLGHTETAEADKVTAGNGKSTDAEDVTGKRGDTSNADKQSVGVDAPKEKKAGVVENDDGVVAFGHDALKEDKAAEAKQDRVNGASPKAMNGMNEVREVDGNQAKVVGGRKQLQAPIKSQRKAAVSKESKDDAVSRNKKRNLAKAKDEVEKQMKVHQDQLHAPIKKPRPKSGVKSEKRIDAKNEKEEDDDPNTENENGDQDLDRTKNNEENEADNVDTEDESRTGFK